MINLKKQNPPGAESRRPILAFFAPNATYPLRDGGAVRSMQIFENLTAHGWDGFIVGANFTLEVTEGVRVMETRRNSHRSKASSAAISLICFDHYIRAKQMSRSLVDHFLTRAAKAQPDFVIMSYLFTGELMPFLANAKVAIDTHNNDWEWFRNLGKDSHNPIQKLICGNSLRRTDAYISRLPAETMLVHVSEDDEAAYRRVRPDIEHVVAPNGCVLKPRQKKPTYDTQLKRLIFVGSLSSRMNIDALRNFESEYWQRLKHCVRLTVVGSNPPNQIEALCQKNRWSLAANVDDDELDHHYEEAHLVIMPFAYGAGSKLKLAEACGRSIPVISTPAGVKGISENLPASVKVSESPDEWRDVIRNYEFPNEDAEAAIRFAEKHTWALSAAKLYTALTGTEAGVDQPETAKAI